MKFINLEQRTPEWKRWRNEGITATDASVILGLNPYKTPWRLWAEKTGKVLPPDLSKNPNVRYGVEHEEDARRLFEARHGTSVIPACAEMTADPIFRASFDGLTPEDEPVEIKCPSESTLNDVRTKGRASKTVQLYLLQVQHQIMVAEAQRGWLVFYDGAANDLIEFEVERDEVVIERIRREGRPFYEKVLSGEEPEKDPLRDVFLPDGEARDAWIRAARDFLWYEEEIKTKKAEVDRLSEMQKQARETLISLLGSNLSGNFAGVCVTRSLVKGRLDPKRLCELCCGRAPTPDEEEAARGAPSERILIRATGEALPKDLVDEKAKKDVEKAEETYMPSFYF